MFSDIKGNTSYHNKMLHKVIRCIASDMQKNFWREPGELEMLDSQMKGHSLDLVQVRCLCGHFPV